MQKKTEYSFNYRVAIIGLGYVGLPLFIESNKFFKTIGYDIDNKKINYLKKTHKKYSKNLTSNYKDLKSSNFFVVCLPTPISNKKIPDLKILKNASKMIGTIMESNSFVIYESTVYPGCTEEVCLPILENNSKFKLNREFFIGYSPERINPGDDKHTISNIVKIVSASNKLSLKVINNFYRKIIKAGTHLCSSIKVAEAAKVIENTQRDLNIAFANELSLMFKKMNINTKEVINASATKWNFMKFSPGLVGGHCIGIDPYYLTFKSKNVDFNPKFILSGREINEKMYRIVCSEIYGLIKKKNIPLQKNNFLILGLSFKDNCDDTRNSQIFRIIQYFKKYNSKIDVYDPLVSKNNKNKKTFNLLDKIDFNKKYDIVILARNHKEFKSISIKMINSLKKEKSVFYDINNYFSSNYSDGHL